MAERRSNGRGGSGSGRSWDIQPKHVVVGLLVLLLVIFAILNTDDVRVHLIFGKRSLPLIVVIVLCALLGFVVGWFVRGRRHR